MRKALIILFLFASSLLSALPMELHVGGNFYADRDYIAADTSRYFMIMSEGKAEVNNIRRLGLGFELTYFPYTPIRLGVTFDCQVLFPIGYQKVGSSGVDAYYSHSYFAKHNLNLGLTYQWMFHDTFGLYVDAGGAISIHAIPDKNIGNSKEKVNYTAFTEYGAYGGLGVVVKHRSAYFKFGFRSLCSLSNENIGCAVAITFAGGYSFSF